MNFIENIFHRLSQSPNRSVLQEVHDGRFVKGECASLLAQIRAARTFIRQAGLKKGDYQEVRMNVNDMVSAMAAKTVDAMVNVEPYNAIAEAEGLAVSLVDFYSFDKLPVFMAATPEYVEKNPDAIVAYLKAWLEVAKDFKEQPQKVADAIFTFYTSKGYKMSKATFAKALANVEVGPGWPSDLKPYMAHHAEVLMKSKKLKAIPDWSKCFREDFMKKAQA